MIKDQIIDRSCAKNLLSHQRFLITSCTINSRNNNHRLNFIYWNFDCRLSIQSCSRLWLSWLIFKDRRQYISITVSCREALLNLNRLGRLSLCGLLYLTLLVLLGLLIRGLNICYWIWNWLSWWSLRFKSILTLFIADLAVGALISHFRALSLIFWVLLFDCIHNISYIGGTIIFYCGTIAPNYSNKNIQPSISCFSDQPSNFSVIFAETSCTLSWDDDAHVFNR